MKRTATTLLLVAALLAGCRDTPPAVEPDGPTEAASPPPASTATEASTPASVTIRAATATATPEPSATPTTAPSGTPLPTDTPAPTPTTEPPPATATPDYVTNPPERPPSPGRTTRGKSYPPGAYEFIHSQFDVPPPLGRVPDEYVASLPAVDPGLCPLTGEAPEDPANLAYRPINIRVDNSAQAWPQLGIGRADVIWETLAEGGITRFTVTFQCRQPETVGPVRSARLIDLQLWPMLDAILVHVGAAQPVTDMIWSSPYQERDIDEWSGDPAFYRVDQAPVDWLRTYTTLDLIAGLAEARGIRAATQQLRGWRFSAEVPPGATGPATRVTIPYTPGTAQVVTYTYDPASGRYFRIQGNSAHVDRATNRQLSATNVMVLFARETVTPIIEDTLGNHSLHYDLRGEGRGLLFRDGQVWDATWRHEGENVMVRVVGADGQPIPLEPGQSFVQVVADTMEVTWE